LTRIWTSLYWLFPRFGGGVRLRFDEIKEDGLVLDFAEGQDRFPGLTELLRDGVRFDGPISGSLHLRRYDNLVEMRGAVKATVEMPCSRCLRPLSLPLTADVDLIFKLLGEAPEEIPEQEEQELQAEDMGVWPVYGDEVDLAEPVQETVILALPAHPLCAQSCKGLCPNCGQDLNEGECDCAPVTMPGPFDALKNFKPEK